MGHLLKLVTHCRLSWRLLSPWERSVSLAAIFIMVLGAMGLVNLLNFDTHLSFLEF